MNDIIFFVIKRLMNKYKYKVLIKNQDNSKDFKSILPLTMNKLRKSSRTQRHFFLPRSYVFKLI